MSLIIRCSQLGKIMTDGKKGEELSAGAKTYLRELLKKEILGYDDEVSSKYLEKGKRCEQESLNLYNTVFFTDYIKNTERRTDGYITGEADILADGLVIDLKTSWSLNTFPLFACDAVNNDYEWQLRGYMRLLTFRVLNWRIAWFRRRLICASTKIGASTKWTTYRLNCAFASCGLNVTRTRRRRLLPR